MNTVLRDCIKWHVGELLKLRMSEFRTTLQDSAQRLPNHIIHFAVGWVQNFGGGWLTAFGVPVISPI